MPDSPDPNVLFSAERTLLAWNRTSSSLMAFGFVVERFGVFLKIEGHADFQELQRNISFTIGISFVFLASFIALFSVWQYRRILNTLCPAGVPAGYNLYFGMITNGIVGLLGAALIIYLLRGIL
ncbi:putative membrane protein [Microbulbifer donghaiensis]|uniref:Putative membrane protein n=1 Tax=Microbulbifer donghaiensis TaxID=494016 RepID=A0A1M5GW73_9GAMM|nr:DUF202 domain-containing protein [Microbulbifer donghaiensis]SHG07960.1 putative membrane protein [Microbulbifer donghaiensis]